MFSSCTKTFLVACFFSVGVAAIELIGGFGGYLNNKKTFGNDNFLIDTNAPMKTIKSFCPAATCSANERNGQSDPVTNRCCIPCDCSNTCNITGTCCADVGAGTEISNKDQNNALVSSCVKTSIGNENSLLFVSDVERYSLIQFCPRYGTTNRNSEIKTKCIQPNTDKLDEIIPVYSNITRINYRNIYCAKCHNDSVNANQWDTHLICRDRILGIIPNLSEQSLLDTIRDFGEMGCIVKWRPITNSAPSCINFIESCPIIYGHKHDYEQFCLELYAPVRGNKGIYRNVFCLACNEDHNACYNTRKDISNLEAFSAVLKTEVLTKTQPNRSGSKVEKCQIGMVYDNVLRECIVKTCPLTQVMVDGTCQSVFLTVNGTGFDYRLKLLYPKDGFTLPPKDEIFSTLRHLVLHHDEIHADLCSEELVGLATEGDYFAVKLWFTKHIKQPTSFYDDYMLFKDKINEFNKRSVNGESRFIVNILEKVEYLMVPADHAYPVSFDLTEPKCFPMAIAMTDIQFCDMVVVKESQCMDRSVTTNNGVTFYPGEYVYRSGLKDLDSISICYDLYVSKMLKARGFPPSGSARYVSVFRGRSFLLVSITICYYLSLISS